MSQMPPLRTIANGQPVDATDPEYNFDTIEGHLQINVINRDGSVAMQAPLILSGPPTQDSHAANKAYVDNVLPPGVMLEYGSDILPLDFVGIWEVCNGQIKSKTDPVYARLFTAIGYKYGGSGDNFNLPDFRKRVAVGADAADPNFVVGKIGGTANGVAAHVHTMGDHIHTGPSHVHAFNHGHGASTTSGGEHVHTTGTFTVELSHRSYAGRLWLFPLQTTGGMASGGSGYNPNSTISAPGINLSSTSFSNNGTVVPYVQIPQHNTNYDGGHGHNVQVNNIVQDTGASGTGNTGPAGNGNTGSFGDLVNGNYPLFATVTKLIRL